MRFDWYSATVEAPRERLMLDLYTVAAEIAGNREVTVEDCRGWNRYPRGKVIAADGDPVARVLWDDEDDAPHVMATSWKAEPVAGMLRERWPHKVSRADLCEDWRGGHEVYDTIRGCLLGVVQGRRVKVTEVATVQGDEGRTLYVGSPSSTVRARLYEKGKTEEGRAQGLPDDLVRLEFVLRPQSKHKEAMARVEPLTMLTVSGWATETASKVLGLDLERADTFETWKRADEDAMLLHMARQYRRALETLLRRHEGNPEGLEAALRALLREARGRVH